MNPIVKKACGLFIVIGFVTFCTIYFTVDLSTWEMLTCFSLQNLLLAIFIWMIGMYFDGLRLQKLVALNGYNVKMTGILQVIFGNYFMGLLTPGASGGALAQVLVLRSIGVPVAKSSMIVIIRTVFSILFLVFTMPIVFFFDNMDIPYIGRQALFYTASSFFLCSILGFWLFYRDFGKRIACCILNICQIKGKKKKRILRFLLDLSNTLRMLLRHPKETALIFLYSGVSLCCIYGIIIGLLWHTGTEIDWLLLLGRMIVLNFILYFAPTPGGTGVAEGFFVILFKGHVPAGTVGILAVIWRLIAEYIPFFIGMYFLLTLFGKRYLLGKTAGEEASEGGTSWPK